MTYEVELKFPMEDFGAVLSRIEQWPAERGSQVEQCDRYFNHPARDFQQTDEALRVRTVETSCWLTYKGPLVDSQTKTRTEIEVPVGRSRDDAEALVGLLSALGFREVQTVRKRRATYHLEWENHSFELAFDDVDGLGQFLEIEAAADRENREAVRDLVLRLAKHLDLKGSIRESYLQLLLQQDRRSDAQKDS